MDKDLAALAEINLILAKLVDGESLTAEEAEKAFYTIFVHDKEAVFFSVLVAAIHTKGETSDELLGFIRATDKLGAKVHPKIPLDKTIDLSGSGGGKLKTFNVSTTASFLVAAAGYYVPKQAYYAVTSPTGSADVFSAFGIDITKLSMQELAGSLEQVGICPYFHFMISPKLANRAKLSRKFFVEQGVKIRTPFHLVSNIYSPIPMQYRVYGLYSDKYLLPVAELLQKLGYKRSLVFWGEPGIPEVSNMGKTVVVEQNSDKLKRYEIKPEDLGVKRAKPEELQTGGKEQNIVDFLRILGGKEKGAKRDLAAINAAAALYVLGHKDSIAECLPTVSKLMDRGAGLSKLEQLVERVGNRQSLIEWKRKAGM